RHDGERLRHLFLVELADVLCEGVALAKPAPCVRHGVLQELVHGEWRADWFCFTPRVERRHRVQEREAVDLSPGQARPRPSSPGLTCPISTNRTAPASGDSAQGIESTWF